MSTVASYLIYQKKDSWLEQWDPRMKIIAALLFGLGLLLSGSLELKSIQIIILIALWAVAKLSWRVLAFTILSLMLFFATTMIYQSVLLTIPGETRIQWGYVEFSYEGAIKGIMMCEQIFGIVILLSLVVRTTSPIILAEGMELLLNVFKRWKVPVHEAVMMFSIALRFLPLLLEEFDKIRKAQTARGGGFHRKGVITRFRGVLPMLVPLFVLAIIRAKELATAMESRCYLGDKGRTPIRLYRFEFRDYLVLIVSVMLLVLTMF